MAGALVGVTVLAGACGSGGNKSVAHLGHTSPTTAAPAAKAGGQGPNYQMAVKYAQCMRANGVPNFPGPGEGLCCRSTEPVTGTGDGLDNLWLA